MAEVTRLSEDQMPPLVDAAYLIGIDRAAVTHALARKEVLRAIEGQSGTQVRQVRTVCGWMAQLARKWGAFEHGNPHLERGLCPECRWRVAIAEDAIQAELDALAPSKERLPVYARLLAEPLMLVRICEAIIASTVEGEGPGEWELDHPHILNLLAHATAHAPVVMMPEGCAEGDCDHQPEEEWGNAEWQCPLPEAAVACEPCSARAGSWAGEWEGQYTEECTVYSPCSVLRAFAKHYGLDVDRVDGLVQL